MDNNFLSKNICNIYKFPRKHSEISSQMIFGEKFKIIKKIRKFYKIKTHYDNYVGFTKNIKYLKKYKPTLKVFILKSQIYKIKKKQFFKSKKFLSFSTLIQNLEERKSFIRFNNNQWIKKKDTKDINNTEKNFKKIFELFKNVKYKWGGKNYNGIDCSALIQIYFKYNNLYFPRDTIDQIKFKKGIKNKSNFKAGDIIYWKGHVAVCLNSKDLIHAYGPRKKVLKMPIKYTIKLIEKTAQLKVKKVIKI